MTDNKVNRDMFRRMAQVVSFLLITAIILFATAGTLRWEMAWAFTGASLLILIINLVVLPGEVIEERGRKKENVKHWDRLLTRITGIPYFSMFPLCGLDHRFGWSPGTGEILSYGFLSLYFIFSMAFTWAMISNRFFSTLVRIQQERGHTVATGGPYRYVRHPGYVAFIGMAFCIPLSLGSCYCLILSGIIAVLFVIRTALEDRTLMKELEGYAAFASRVRYRLIPYLW